MLPVAKFYRVLQGLELEEGSNQNCVHLNSLGCAGVTAQQRESASEWQMFVPLGEDNQFRASSFPNQLKGAMNALATAQIFRLLMIPSTVHVL